MPPAEGDTRLTLQHTHTHSEHLTPVTCHEEEESRDVLRQALLPEETHRRHDAPTQQDGCRHAEKARRDPPQV